MDLKLLKKAIAKKAHNKRNLFKGAAKSYVSLFLVGTLVAVGTVSWLIAKDNVSIETPVMELKSANGIHDDQMQTRHTELTIPEFRLEEASSIDGRNIYFPVSTVNNVNDATAAVVATTKASESSDTLVNWTTTNSNMKAQTEAMRFREGNAGDKNKRYAYVDTTINAAGGTTKVWLKGYNIKLGSNEYKDEIEISYNASGKPTGQSFPNPYSCPIRIAIIDDSGHTPKVFDPAAKITEYANNTYAVMSVNSEGVPTTRLTSLKSFSEYYYGTNNPLFEIEPGHSINMTVVAWLEGTHPYARNFIGQTMTVSLEIETNVSAMEDIYLHDWTIGDTYNDYQGNVTQSNYIDAGNYTKVESGEVKCQGKWLASDGVDIAMSYYDQYANTYKTVMMTELDSTNITAADMQTQGINSSGKDAQGRTVYRAAIPKYVSTKISFYRLSKVSDDVYPGTVFNAWHTYGEKNAQGVITSSVNDHLSSTASGWIGSSGLNCALKIDRTITGAATNYQHYYALRGNGNGHVTHNNPNRYELWLGPGIGYWGTKSAPVFG